MKPTALDAPTDQLDNDEQHFVGIIREHGWFHTHVLGDEEGPGFDYTTGFQIGLGHPEIITFDMGNLNSAAPRSESEAVESGKGSGRSSSAAFSTSRPFNHE